MYYLNMKNLWHKQTDGTQPPIDFVIPWVDGADPDWLHEREQYNENAGCSDTRDVRYRDWNNLQYWFRGVEENAPWVRKIHLITWGHVPKWLDVNHPKLNIVYHKDYIPSRYLPTFNSHTIELNLHRIPGLSECFVYFNDDIFVTDTLSPSDFFKNGLPCDTFSLNCIFFGNDSVGHIHGSDIEAINRNFNKKRLMKKVWKKWFNPKNGLKNIVRTSLLMPWPWFPGLYYQHLANAYCKSTFETVWAFEEDNLDRTCCCRFRDFSNLNQWIFKFWQLASGAFYPRSSRLGRCFHIKDSNYLGACNCIKESTYRLICLNDTANTTDFELKKNAVLSALEERFPHKSSFEL